MNFDAVVIGAGAVGGSAAFQLAEAGLKVALVDRAFPGAGTSRATKAGIGVYPKKPHANLVINMKGSELYPQIAARLGEDFELEMNGVVNVALTADEMAKMESFVAKQHETPGYTATLLTGDQARAMEPELSQIVVGAAYCPLDGQINPMLYCAALARGVERLGGQVIVGTEVLGIEEKGGHRWSVRTSQGDMDATWVANCTGAWSPLIGRMVGVEIPIVPNRGHVLVSEPIAPFLRHRISGPTLIRQTTNGNVAMGYSEELVGYDKEDAVLALLAAQAEIARRLLPALEKVKVIRGFLGLRPWPADGLPVIGEIPGKPGFLVAAGHSGITWSPAAGRLLAEIVTGAEPCLPLEPYSITRFSKN